MKEEKMSSWIKGGFIGGGIGVVLHLIINFSPLILSAANFASEEFGSATNLNLSYNLSRIIIYFIGGALIGGLIGKLAGKN